jgi:adenylate cyclase class 2
MIEVELKFPVDSLTKVRDQLVERGAKSNATANQSDEYINDPLRDFAKLDFALRIRNNDGKYWLTFKGPNLDETAKIRQEVEMPLMDSDAADQIKDVFSGIGFVSVAKVEKRREVMELSWKDEQVTVCLDDVAEVGGFLELELVVADESASLSAKGKLIELAEEMGLTNPIRTSYLELLLRRRGKLTR